MWVYRHGTNRDCGLKDIMKADAPVVVDMGHSCILEFKSPATWIRGLTGQNDVHAVLHTSDVVRIVEALVRASEERPQLAKGLALELKDTRDSLFKLASLACGYVPD
jgi:hypothetical protein